MLSKIKKDMIVAMKSQNKEQVGYLRLMIAELQNAEKASGKEQSDSDQIKTLQSYKKKLTKALSSYSGDKKVALEDELSVVESYLPQEASEEDTRAAIEEVLRSTENRNFGPLMGQVMKKLTNPNSKLVQKILKESL